jgi:diguanylate cyclase (GGDEF)-like protein
MWLSKEERELLEKINQGLEDDYLIYFPFQIDSFSPDSPVLRLAQSIRNVRETTQVQRAKDVLTGLWSKKFMLEFLERAIAKAVSRRADTACIALLDVDGLIYLNNELTHRIGDQALQAISKILSKHLQPLHFVGRIGGDEFLGILDVPVEEARALLAKVQSEIAAMVFSKENQEAQITASIVLSEITRDDTVESCLTRVEGGMYPKQIGVQVDKPQGGLWIV